MLSRITFLIHPFCYAHLSSDDALAPYARREQACAARWLQGVMAMAPDEAMVIVTAHGGTHEATDAFIRSATRAIGERCMVVGGIGYGGENYWETICRDAADAARIAFESQQQTWSAEELHQHLHVHACVKQFNQALADRGIGFDPASVTARAWGVSFEGCVTKYSLEFRHHLGIRRVIDIPFDMTVPDAAFLCDAKLRECVILTADVRAFIFDCNDAHVAVYVGTSHAITHRPRWLQLPDPSRRLRAINKSAKALAPAPGGTSGCDNGSDTKRRAETCGDPNHVVRREGDALILPVNMGFAYRPAKAPAFVVADRSISASEFRDGVLTATPM